MATIEETRSRISAELGKITAGLNPRELYEPIDYTLEVGGKRIRPALVTAGCDLFSGDLEKAVNPAVSIELFHNFTLLHDDIMDKAPIRRGRPTVYRKWNENTAILSGDTLFTLALDALSGSDPALLPDLLKLFTKTAREVCEGQQLDMNFETRNDVSIDDYLEMIRLKTAVLLGCSLKIGAIVAGAGKTDSEKIYSFGQNIGLAFQLQDDLLDTFGDPVTFGKEIGGDIACNKKTFLYIQALESADENTRNALTAMYMNWEGDSEEKIELVKSVFRKLGIEEKTRRVINRYFDHAIQDLDSVNVSEEKKKYLREFAFILLNRKF